MSDIGKQALKTKINSKVYENSSQAITGAAMNEVLQDMVDTLCDGANLDAGSVTDSRLQNPVSVSQNTLMIGGTETNIKAVYVQPDQQLIIGNENEGALGGVYIESENYIWAVTDTIGKILIGAKADGKIYFGADCPPQVKEYVEQKIGELNLDDVPNIVAFLGDLIQNDDTLQELLNQRGEYIDNPYWVDVKTDSQHRILEGIDTNGNKYIGSFSPETQKKIKDFVGDSGNAINIPMFDANFVSPVPCEIIGIKGDKDAQYKLQLPLSAEAFNIRFRFRITENLINQNKTAVIVKFGGVDAVTAKGSPLSQKTTTITYGGQEKTNYWMCLNGGVRLNNSLVSYDDDNHHIGSLAFSVKYTGVEDAATIENTGNSIIIKIGSTTNTFPFADYPTISELYEAIKLLNDIEVDYRELNNRESTELATFSESKLKTTMYTGVTGATDAPITEYIDAAPFMLPYSVEDEWHNVEITKIAGVIYCSVDGILTELDVLLGESTSLILGGDCGVLFKDFRVISNTSDDAEYVDGTLISSFNPYIIIYEGHGMDKVPSIEATTSGNMNVTTDRLQYVFNILKSKGYIPVSIYDIVDYYNGNKMLPKRCYTLIFDDFRFDNVMDINNREVFTRFGVKPSLAIISNNMGVVPIEHDEENITTEEAITICKMFNFDLVSHTRNHRSNDAIKPSEMINELIGDNYKGEIKGIDGSILVFPYGAVNPYLFWAMNWLGYRLGVNVWGGNYNYIDNKNRSKYNLIRYEIGMRLNLITVLNGIK